MINLNYTLVPKNHDGLVSVGAGECIGDRNFYEISFSTKDA